MPAKMGESISCGKRNKRWSLTWSRRRRARTLVSVNEVLEKKEWKGEKSSETKKGEHPTFSRTKLRQSVEQKIDFVCSAGGEVVEWNASEVAAAGIRASHEDSSPFRGWYLPWMQVLRPEVPGAVMSADTTCPKSTACTRGWSRLRVSCLGSWGGRKENKMSASVSAKSMSYSYRLYPVMPTRSVARTATKLSGGRIPAKSAVRRTGTCPTCGAPVTADSTAPSTHASKCGMCFGAESYLGRH